MPWGSSVRSLVKTCKRNSWPGVRLVSVPPVVVLSFRIKSAVGSATVTLKFWEREFPAASTALTEKLCRPACATVGIQVMTPVVGLIVAPVGGVTSEYWKPAVPSSGFCTLWLKSKSVWAVVGGVLVKEGGGVMSYVTFTAVD